MSNPDQEELINLIEKDIQSLKANIITDLNRFELEHIRQSEFDVLNFNLLIDYEYIRGFVESECYQLRSPVFTTIGSDLSIRLQLFNKIFLSQFSRVNNVSIHRHFQRQMIGDFEQTM